MPRHHPFDLAFVGRKRADNLWADIMGMVIIAAIAAGGSASVFLVAAFILVTHP